MRFRLFAAAALAAMALSACKVQITVPAEGGTVTTESGNYNCGAGQQCEVVIDSTEFDESFRAVADAGYRFIGWKKANRHFCGGNNADCNLVTSAFGGNPTLMSFLNGENANQTFYLVPEFEELEVGGAAWLHQQTNCDGFSGYLDSMDEGPNAPEFGVLDGEFSVEGKDCSDYSTFTYEVSPTTGERRLREISPPISQSAQCPDDPDCGRQRESETFNYVELSRQGVAVERLKRIDTYSWLLGYADDNVGIDESIVLGYEQNISTEGRLISYEEWTLENDENGEQPVVTVTYEASWNYNGDGSVSTVSTNTFDEDLGNISGEIRYVLEGGGLVAYSEAEILGDTYTMGKKVFHDRGVLDALSLRAPPTGQIETENDWVLPENYTEYRLDFDSGQLVPTEKLEIVRSSFQGYPLETLESYWDPDAGAWVNGFRSLYGYRTDNEGTVYRKVELIFRWDTVEGRWEPDLASINSFRSDPLIYNP